MSKKILFLCRGNSARSQMAEAIVNAQYKEIFIAFSAGISPADQLNPYAIATMKNIGIDISGCVPKSIDVFANEEFDFIITLCSKGKEECINYIGKPILSHWDLPNPVDIEGTEKEIMRVFGELLKYLNTRIRYLASMSPDKLEKLATGSRTIEICPMNDNLRTELSAPKI